MDKKVKIYDIASIDVNLSRNLKSGLYDSGKMDQVDKVYDSIGEYVFMANPVAPSHPNYLVVKTNQEACSVSSNGRSIELRANLSKMIAYATSSSSSSVNKWVALLVNTGTNDITTVKYNGRELTATDVSESANFGGGPGILISWVKAEQVVDTPKVFTIEKNGIVEAYTVRTINVK